jgi:hypothetical protein
MYMRDQTRTMLLYCIRDCLRRYHNVSMGASFTALDHTLNILEPARMDASTRSECLPGTRTDILRSIADWAHSTSVEKWLLWLKGLAGSGKSTLSTTIAHTLQEQGCLGAFVFFSRDVEERNQSRMLSGPLHISWPHSVQSSGRRSRRPSTRHLGSHNRRYVSSLQNSLSNHFGHSQPLKDPLSSFWTHWMNVGVSKIGSPCYLLFHRNQSIYHLLFASPLRAETNVISDVRSMGSHTFSLGS